MLLAVRVRMDEAKDAVTPEGSPEAVKLTDPLKPPTGVMVIEVLPLLPCVIETLLGVGDRLKSGATVAETLRLTVVVWLKLPEVPVIVAVVGPPTVAVLLAVSVRVLPLNDAVTPLGRPEAEYETVPVKPFFAVTVIVLVPVLPCTMLTLLGEEDRLKSGAGAVAGVMTKLLE